MTEIATQPATARFGGLARNALRLITGAYWLLMLVATHLPPRNVPNTHVNDKIEHFAAYGLLTTLLAACFWKSKLRTIAFFATLIGITWFYGAFDELTQPYFGRTCDIHDWLADASAASVVAAAASGLRNRLKRSAPV